MNKLFIGLTKTIELPEGNFLLIADEVPKQKMRVFDPLKHSFNPLKDIDYKKARQIVEILYAVYPQGENTLTVRDGKRALLLPLLKAKRLDQVETDDEDVTAMIEDLLVSPVLRKVLCNSTTFPFNTNSPIAARINRSELGDFDALVLGLLLMAHFPGQVVVSDFGFYGRDFHANLIRQERLIAGINFLDELPPKLRQHMLLIEDKFPSGALYSDAETLANYAGHRPDRLREDNKFNNYVDDATL